MPEDFDVEVTVRMGVVAYNPEHLKDQMDRFCQVFPDEMRLVGQDGEHFCGERFNPRTIVMSWSEAGHGNPRDKLYTHDEVLQAFNNDPKYDSSWKRDIRKALAKVEHEQWIYWTKAIAPMLEKAMDALQSSMAERMKKLALGEDDAPDYIVAQDKMYKEIRDRLKRWRELWDTPWESMTRNYWEDDYKWADEALRAIRNVMKEYTGIPV